MSDIVLTRNVAALIEQRDASSSYAETSGGTNDNTTLTGVSFDRESIGPAGALPMSMVAGVDYNATLASGSSLAVQIIVNDSADNSSFAVYASNSSTSVSVATGASGGGAITPGQVNLAVNLTSARRYIRVDHIARLTRGGTDTAQTRAVATFAGFDRLPATL